MTFTVSTYLNNITATSPEYQLAQSILSKISLVTNNGALVSGGAANPGLATAARGELPALLNQLLNSMVNERRVSASTIIALIAAAAATGGRAINDIGALGTVTVSGSAITLAAGAA